MFKTCEIIISAMICIAVCSFMSMWVCVYGLYVSEHMPSKFERTCKDYSCNVTVFDERCFAAFIGPDADYPTEVKCDKTRSGFYQVVLPCDKDSDNKPKINCDVRNKNKSLIFDLSLFGFLACFALCFICSAIPVMGNYDNSTGEINFTSSGDVD